MVDFDRDRLTYHMYSTEGPAFAKADVNGDGIDDLFFGGAKGFEAKLYLGNSNGKYTILEQAAFPADLISEDIDAIFFDANQDGKLDLFVCSGGNESSLGSPDLSDRLYLNDGKGNFTKTLAGIRNGYREQLSGATHRSQWRWSNGFELLEFD